MPLSEHEQRMLEQMERALYAEDPKFASSLRGADLRSHYRRRAIEAGAGFLVGIVLLMTGLVAQIVVVSVLGFVLMLASATFAVTSLRRIPNTEAKHPGHPAGAAPTRQKAPRQGIVARFEERWRRRRDEQGM